MRLLRLNTGLVLLCIVALVILHSCKTGVGKVCIAFYNVENLFDTLDDPNKIDEQFLPGGDYDWTAKKYASKLDHLAQVISKLNSGKAPDILGLCEVENMAVLVDLVNDKQLSDEGYGIVHFESPDARGIDVALLYRKSMFRIKDSKPNILDLSSYGNTTRDILQVELESRGKVKETIHVLVNHWPSRRGGLAESEPKRVKAAKTLKAIVDGITDKNSKANIVIMGDFNDEPFNKSIRDELATAEDFDKLGGASLFNPMARLKQAGLGSYNYRGNWNMLDQIIISKALLDGEKAEYEKYSAKIFSPEWLRQHGGTYDQYPFRTFGGRKYLNGYSDHFAVSIQLTFESK
jgi:predicted extracellular nuclease